MKSRPCAQTLELRRASRTAERERIQDLLRAVEAWRAIKFDGPIYHTRRANFGDAETTAAMHALYAAEDSLVKALAEARKGGNE